MEQLLSCYTQYKKCMKEKKKIRNRAAENFTKADKNKYGERKIDMRVKGFLSVFEMFRIRMALRKFG